MGQPFAGVDSGGHVGGFLQVPVVLWFWSWGQDSGLALAWGCLVAEGAALCVTGFCRAGLGASWEG